jgi:DNA-binding NarL/FixJ family response regulator
MGGMITVALVDDHPLILKILGQELGRDARLQVIWEASDVAALRAGLARQVPNVLVLDLSLGGPGYDPVTMVRDLRARFAQLRVLILTAQDDPVWVEELIRAGAAGYVIKSDDLSLRLRDAIQAVAEGRSFLSPSAAESLSAAGKRHSLTPRERAILRLVAEGHANPAIAEVLGISDSTVRNHLSNIYAKLGVNNREAAVRAAQAERELPKPGASLRHELRTPLHTLLGLARLLQTKLGRHGALGPDDGLFLEQIILEAERLDHLLSTEKFD